MKLSWGYRHSFYPVIVLLLVLGFIIQKQCSRFQEKRDLEARIQSSIVTIDSLISKYNASWFWDDFQRFQIQNSSAPTSASQSMFDELDSRTIAVATSISEIKEEKDHHVLVLTLSHVGPEPLLVPHFRYRWNLSAKDEHARVVIQHSDPPFSFPTYAIIARLHSSSFRETASDAYERHYSIDGECIDLLLLGHDLFLHEDLLIPQ